MKSSREKLKKVGIYVDEKTWNELKEFTLRKYGTTRKLSSEVQEILKANLPSGLLREGVDKLGITPGRISESEVKEGRPKMEISSVDIVREMRAPT